MPSMATRILSDILGIFHNAKIPGGTYDAEWFNPVRGGMRLRWPGQK